MAKKKVKKKNNVTKVLKRLQRKVKNVKENLKQKRQPKNATKATSKTGRKGPTEREHSKRKDKGRHGKHPSQKSRHRRRKKKLHLIQTKVQKVKVIKVPGKPKSDSKGDFDLIKFVRTSNTGKTSQALTDASKEVVEERIRKTSLLQSLKPSLEEQPEEMIAVQTIGANFLKSLKPLMLMGTVLGRFPITYNMTPEDLLIFSYHAHSPKAVAFVVSNIVITTLFFAGVWTAFCLWMEVPLGVDFIDIDQNAVTYLGKYGIGKNLSSSEERNALYLRNRPERYIFDRHIVFFIAVWAHLLHCVAGGWHFLMNRKQVVDYYNFWIRSLYTMKMDVTKGVNSAIYFMGGTFVTFMVISFILLALRAIPSAIGLPAVVAITLARAFDADLMNVNQNPTDCRGARACLPFRFLLLQFLSVVIVQYLIWISYLFIFCFVIMCKFLKTAFGVWNGRLYSILLRGGHQSQSHSRRTTYELLFKDHCVLLDLLEATDRVFTIILETFLGLQALSFCFEIHFVIRTGRSGSDQLAAEKDDYYIRPYDWVGGLLLISFHTIFLLMTLQSSSDVGDEAMAGLEIVRRRSLLGRQSDAELHFIMSLFASYTSHKPLYPSAYGFFSINREFIMAILATVMSYFTIVYQFDPKFDFQRESDDTPRTFIERFIQLTEFSYK